MRGALMMVKSKQKTKCRWGLGNALAVSEDTKWQLIFSAVQSMNSN